MTARATPCRVHPAYDGTLRYNYGDIVWHHNACYRCVQYAKGSGAYWERFHHDVQETPQAACPSPDRLDMLEF